MKHNNKIFILIILLIGTFLLVGCKKLNFGTYDASNEKAGIDVTTVPEDNQNTTVNNLNTENETTITQAPGTETTVDTTPTAAAIEPSANIDLPIYIVNGDAEIELVTALVPEGSEITPALIVDTVKEALADQSIDIGIDEVITQGDTVIVSFKKGTPPSTGLGSGYEAAILNAIAQSLMDNLKDYKNVIYRIEGEAYISGVYEYRIDEVFLGDN